VAKTIRGVTFEENENNAMGLEFYNLSHRFGYQSPNWPYFEDVKIERIHYMAKSGVLSQRITTSMHNTTHIDAPAHVVQGTPFIDEVPLPHFSVPALSFRCQRKNGSRSPMTIWRRRRASMCARETSLSSIPAGTGSTTTARIISVTRPVLYRQPANGSSKSRSRSSVMIRKPTIIRLPPRSGRSATDRCIRIWRRKQDFPEWEPVHRILFKNGILGIENVGGDLDQVTGRRCTFAFFPWNWDRGDGCIIRLVAIVDPKGAYRIENGERFA
jgi:kynurenine formamidase